MLNLSYSILLVVLGSMSSATWSVRQSWHVCSHFFMQKGKGSPNILVLYLPILGSIFQQKKYHNVACYFKKKKISPKGFRKII